MKAELIAPCGMNCNLCSNYLALQNDAKAKGVKLPYCIGCRERDKKCAFLKKKCNTLLKHHVEFCYQCNAFPCKPLIGLATRYAERYRMNMIDNLRYIQKHGLPQFLETEKKKWECPHCGTPICCHNGICYTCNLETMKTKKKRYRWED